MIQLKDVLHYYLGCSFVYNNGPKVWDGWNGLEKTCTYYYSDEEKSHIRIGSFGFQVSKIKLILRPLSDMTEEEKKEYEATRVFVRATPVHQVGNMQWTSATFHYLLSKHFDLFGLIESGQAIDKTKL